MNGLRVASAVSPRLAQARTRAIAGRSDRESLDAFSKAVLVAGGLVLRHDTLVYHAIDDGHGVFIGCLGGTLVAGVATELVRDDQDGVRTYLILPSRSFGLYMYDVILDAGGEFGLA